MQESNPPPQKGVLTINVFVTAGCGGQEVSMESTIKFRKSEI